MKNISTLYAYIVNLSATAKHHYSYCNDSECAVSLHLLRETGKLLLNLDFANQSEKEEATKLVEEMPNC